MKQKPDNLVAGRLDSDQPRNDQADDTPSRSQSAYGYERLGLVSDAAEPAGPQIAEPSSRPYVPETDDQPQEHRRAFLGKVAAAMLAAVGAISAGCGREDVKGTRPDPGSKTTGSRPDVPEEPEPPPPAPTGIRPD